MYKKFRRLCAWALAVITVLSVVPASGAVSADEKENASATESTVSFSVPNSGGSVEISIDDEVQHTLKRNSGGIYLDDVLVEEEEDTYPLEMTLETGTIIQTTVEPDKGYQVSSYRILSDAGEEIEDKSLSSENKYDVEVTEDPVVVEIKFEEETTEVDGEEPNEGTVSTTSEETEEVDDTKDVNDSGTTTNNTTSSNASTTANVSSGDSTTIKEFITEDGEMDSLKLTEEEIQSYLPGTIYVEFTNGEKEDISVTWKCTKDYDDTNLENYTFIGYPDEKYSLADGLSKEDYPRFKVNVMEDPNAGIMPMTLPDPSPNGTVSLPAALGTTGNYINYLDNNGSRYLGTPYNGNFTSEYATSTPGVGMNCTGFVGHVLASNGADLNRIRVTPTPDYGGSRTWTNLSLWTYYLQNNNAIIRYKYNSSAAALASGMMRKGDILLMEPSSDVWIAGQDRYGNAADCHIGFFWGANPHDNKFWHSSQPTVGCEGSNRTVYAGTNPGNQISNIAPKCESYCYIVKMTGQARIKKESSNTSLTNNNSNYSVANAVYTIYKNRDCTQSTGKSFTIGSNGYSNTVTLASGTYYYKETTAGKGYLIDNNVYTLEVVNNATITGTNVSATRKDTPKHVKIALDKVSNNPDISETITCAYSLEGAEYGVYTDSACKNLVGTMVTDENGEATLDNLPLDTYYVKETKASMGFAKDPKVYTVKAESGTDVSDNKTEEILREVESEEAPLMDPVGLLLQKVDAETGTAVPVDEGTLQDAQFEVKFYDTFMTTDPGDAGFEPVWSAVMRTDDHGEMWLLNSYVVSGDHVYTDSKGVQSLPFGTITFKEIKSPNGYLINDEVIVQQIRGEDGGVTTVPQYTEPTQEEQPMTLKIIKVQNGTTLPIPDAEFEWVLPDGSNHTYSTDENGEVFFKGLEWGKHTITEVKVPDGYSVNKNKITFTVNQDNTITDASGATVTDTDGNFTLVIDEDNLNPTVTYENKPAPFDLHVYKINDVDFALEGAEFTIYTDEDCTDVWKVGKTDTNGDLTFEDLIVGKTYYMKETKAPQGYRIPINEDGSDIVYKIMVTSTPVKDQFTFYVNDEPYTTSSNGMFTVTGTKADRICNITVINERGKQLPETGSSMMLILLAAGIALMGGAVVASQTRKLSNKRR